MRTIPGVLIQVTNINPVEKARTDVNGVYRLENIPPGRYTLLFTFIGYKDVVIPNLIVNSGKEVILDISLEESVNQIGEVQVSARKDEMNNDNVTNSGRAFTMEDVNRFAGSRSDPARMAANFAGVSSADDTRNDLVIRGNSPSGVLWRIEGMNIGNPNHFSTVGTTGGPISAINANLLRNSDFMTSAFPAEYGNANAGVFDLGFRNGNTEKREHTFQLGILTGLEFSTEGPIGKGSGASYVFAYRYGFASVAQNIGLSVGTAATPYYQDFSFKVNSKQTKLGKFTFFGIGAISKIDFYHDKVDTTDLFVDPTKDSFFESRLAVFGVKHIARINDASYVKTVVGVNYSNSDYSQDRFPLNGEKENEVINYTKRLTYSLNTSYNHKVTAKLFFKAGVIVEAMNTNLFYTNRMNQIVWDTIWNANKWAGLTQAYTHVKYSFTDQLVLNIGLHAQTLSLNKEVSIEPRAGLKYQFKKAGTLSFGYGLHSQMQPTDVYFLQTVNSNGELTTSNQRLGFTKSHHNVLGYEVKLAAHWKMKTEIYYQYLYNVPVDSFPSSYSMLNAGASFFPNQNGGLVNTGTGQNYGLELTLERTFYKGFYGMFTGSIYKSTYAGSDLVSRNTAFNGRYVYNVLAGKEFKVGKDKRNAISLDVKFTHAGGRPYTPVDVALSQLYQTQILQGDSEAFTKRYPDFMRLDVKIGFRLNAKMRNIAQSWSFDVNNVTNRKNIFAERYNPVTNSMNTAYQIGFFPNFVYKIEF